MYFEQIFEQMLMIELKCLFTIDINLNWIDRQMDSSRKQYITVILYLTMVVTCDFSIKIYIYYKMNVEGKNWEKK